MAITTAPTLAPVRAVFRALVETAAPAAALFGRADWARAEALVEDALGQRPSAVRRQFAGFLLMVQHLPVLRYGRRFSRLDPSRRLRVLRGLEGSSLLLVRRGVWGARTLAFLAVYGQPGERARIGYRPDPRGWEARPGAATAATHGEVGP